ncbi:MAG TPA: BadF/BadG/BcrA/BcrD ATPase family protein [Candidatus Sulfotelmatobacter sp.]|nr:BadF/BadG/BcrA/BcrD ATPase family protein [Candidatus Sulfotelmatobacter sp.]
MAYYLGIDGGGSKTTCAVGDESSLLATFTAGPSNITRVGEAGAREALQEAIFGACRAAKINPQQVRRACVGAAGAGRKDVASAVGKIVAEIIPGEIQVVGDMEIALTAAFGGGPGVIVIAGTGSIAYGRDAKGRTARSGGWGFAVSDEGSAYWIGRAAVSAVLRASDRVGDDQTEQNHAEQDQAEQDRAEQNRIRPAGRLFRELKTAWSVDSLEQLARAANANADFSVLFPAVLAAAGAGDVVAREVIAEASSELAQLAGLVLRRLFPGQRSAALSAVPMAIAGGVFRHATMIRELFYNGVRAANPDVVLNLEVVDPVHGALRMARRTG